MLNLGLYVKILPKKGVHGKSSLSLLTDIVTVGQSVTDLPY
jgi:hypothetical protein